MKERNPWIFRRQAAAMVPMDQEAFGRIALIPENRIRRIEIKGSRTRYHIDDVARLVAEAHKIPECMVSVAMPGDEPGTVRIVRQPVEAGAVAG